MKITNNIIFIINFPFIFFLKPTSRFGGYDPSLTINLILFHECQPITKYTGMKKKKVSDNDRKKETEIEEGRVCGGDQPA